MTKPTNPHWFDEYFAQDIAGLLIELISDSIREKNNRGRESKFVRKPESFDRD